jgi:hypothetical protein
MSTSYIVTYEDPDGTTRSNQVNAPDRDSAIWRLALLMQTPQRHITSIKFVSCVPEVA